MKRKRFIIQNPQLIVSTNPCSLFSDAVSSEVAEIFAENEDHHDPHELDLNQVNDLICGLPFHKGRGDLIRDVKAGLLSISSNIHSVGDNFLKKVNIEKRVQRTLQCYT